VGFDKIRKAKDHECAARDDDAGSMITSQDSAEAEAHADRAPEDTFEVVGVAEERGDG
jgi:hypothetical protein